MILRYLICKSMKIVLQILETVNFELLESQK